MSRSRRITASRATAGERLLERLLLAGAGALQTLVFVHTRLWWLPILGAALLAWRLDRSRGLRHAATLGWCYGTGWMGAGIWWLFISMHRYGHLPAWLAASAVALLVALLALFLALATALYRRWRRGGWGDAPLFAALWLAAELARGLLLTGFPWVASGYALPDSPLAVLAPWVGVYGMGFVLALLAGAVAQAGAARGSARGVGPAVAVAALVACTLLGTGEFTTAGRTLNVELLQTNVPQDEKFDAQRLPARLQ